MFSGPKNLFIQLKMVTEKKHLRNNSPVEKNFTQALYLERIISMSSDVNC